MTKPGLPWVGLTLCALGTGTLIYVTRDAPLSLAIFLVWAGSLFVLPRQAERGLPPDPEQLFGPEKIRELIEPLSQPYLVMERRRIIIANRAAREVLGPHVVGQDARVALRHPEAVRLLERGGSAQAVIKGLTGPRSIWQVALRPIDARRTSIELVNRTAEADISRAHTDFVANASHELRTPLASIIGYVETLIEADAEGARPIPATTRLKFLETVAREGKRLQALVEDLMSLSRIEAEKHDLPPTVFDLRERCESVVSGIAALHGKERLIFDRANIPMPVRGDSQQIDQLLRNLVDNALKYGSETEPVGISLQSNGPHFILSVADRGDGIAPEHLPHLTRRFYRTDPGRSRAVGGTGLGLAIVKHIIERHRGRLDIESKLGEGTTVTVRLPRNVEETNV